MSNKKMSKLKKYLNRFAARQVIEQRRSKVNHTLEVIQVGDITMLNSANTNYSYGGLHRVFQKAFEEVKLADRTIGHALILGFGAGSVATIMRDELLMQCRITGVEKDPVVIRLGNEYFNTGRFTGLDIVEMDAVEFITKENQQFDLIIVDVYVDFEVPEDCETMEFISNTDKCLAAGGMLLFNKMVYNHQAAKEADELKTKFNKLPGITNVIKIREKVVNKVIVYEKPFE